MMTSFNGLIVGFSQLGAEIKLALHKVLRPLGQNLSDGRLEQIHATIGSKAVSGFDFTHWLKWNRLDKFR